MKNIIKEFLYFTRWIISYLIGPKTKKYDNSNKRIVVVGNGPSVADFPFDLYSDCEMCTVNFFALDEELFKKIRPRFYCIIDNAFFDGSMSENVRFKKLNDIFQDVDWEMTIITFPQKTLNISNKYISYHYITECKYSGEMNKIKYKIYSENKGNCGYQNVIVASIYYFIMSSANTIYLTGVENDWHRELFVDSNNDVLREDTHFYGKEFINLTQKGEINKGELYKYFLFYYTTLYNYYNMSVFSEMKNVCIKNTCLNSYIDVFPKEKIRG